MMNSGRLKILGAAAVFLAAVLLWRWVAGRGLVTVDFDNAPVAKVVAALQRQTGLTILTNAAPETRVTLKVRRAPAFVALDLLAVRLDGDMRQVCAVAPSRAQARAGLEAVAASFEPEGWRVVSAGWGRGGGAFGVGEAALDLRRVSLKPSPMDDRSLQAFLVQAAAKTGMTFVVPEDWNPQLSKFPGPGTAEQVAAAAARAAGGRLEQAVVITVRPEGPGTGDRGGRTVSGEAGGRGPRGPSAGEPRGDSGARRTPLSANPEWIAERVEAQIALLPREEQAQARREFQEMRALWEEVRNAPEGERRAKLEEVLSRPEVQERIEERMAARDMKRTPEQRAQRYKRYIERKRQALDGQ